MPMDFSKMDDKSLLELYNRSKQSQTSTAPGVTQNQDINALISKATKPTGVRQNIGDALSILGGGKALNADNDLSKLYAQEAIKNQFEDPTVRQLREAEILALQQPPPQGFVRVGKQTLPDPDYVKPKDQAEMDAAAAQKNSEAESLRASAEDNLATIQKVKEGANYFGPYGNIPSIADPASVLGLNQKHFASRKEWENNTNKLLSQKVLDIISEMKRVSKTGATGFGQLSEKEGAILQQASTALSKDLPKEQALYYLNEMEKIHRKVLGAGVSENNNQDNDPLGVL